MGRTRTMTFTHSAILLLLSTNKMPAKPQPKNIVSTIIILRGSSLRRLLDPFVVE
jgi:hypothetical protein